MGILGGNEPGQPRYSGELHNLQVTQSVFGTTVPILIGTNRVAGKLMFYGNFVASPAPSGGKGIFGGKSDEYVYSADTLIALGSGAVNKSCQGILNVWDQGGKLVNEGGSMPYTIPSGGGSMSPVSGAQPQTITDLGVSKSVSYSVMANDYGSGGSRTLTGTQNVAFTKVASSPSAGQYSYNASTATYTFSAADAGIIVLVSYSTVYSLYYYEATQAAEIPTSSPYQVTTTNEQYFWSDGGVVRVDTGAALTQGASTGGYTESDGVYTFTSDLAGVYVYISYEYTSNDPNLTNTSSLNLTFFGGSAGQLPWSYMQSKYPGSAFGYTGICYVGANPLSLGESGATPSYNYEVIGLVPFGGGIYDAHPCDAFYLLLQDAMIGVGFPSSMIDPWTSCYAYWAANGYFISKSIDTQTSVTEAMQAIIETGNVAAVWSSGLLKLIPYGDATCVGNGYTYTPNTTPVVTLQWKNLLPESDGNSGKTGHADPLQVSQRAPQDCWNYVQAQWTNRLNDYNVELINEQNDAFITQYGQRMEAPQTWDWITTQATASWALNLRLKRQCYIRNKYKFWLNYTFSYLEPMDMVLLPTGEAVRILQVTDSPDGRLAIEAEQWSYGTASVSIYSKQAPSSFQPSLTSALPGNAVPIVVQNTITQSVGVPYLVQIGATGNNANWGGANIYISLDGETFTSIGSVSAPTVFGILSSNLPYSTDPDTTDTLSVDLTLSVPGSELVTVSQLLADKLTTLCAIIDQNGESSELIAYETATLTASGRYNLTYLRRGVYGSEPAAHTTGASFAFLGPNYKFADYQYAQALMGHTLYVKLQSYNLAGSQVQSLATCPVYTYTLGYQTGEQGETYYPSGIFAANTAPVDPVGGRPIISGNPGTPTTTGGATVTGFQNAYDGNFTSSAVFDGGPFASTPSNYISIAVAYYSGFPSVVTEYPTTLYVSYQNLQGVTVFNSTYPTGSGGSASVNISINGYVFSTVFSNGVEDGTSGVSVTLPTQGTITANIPAGVNLSSLVVAVGAYSESTTTHTTPAGAQPGHIEILRIWVQ